MNLPWVDSGSHRRARTTRRIVRTVSAAFAIALAGSPATAQSRKVLGWLPVGGGVGLAVSTFDYGEFGQRPGESCPRGHFAYDPAQWRSGCFNAGLERPRPVVGRHRRDRDGCGVPSCCPEPGRRATSTCGYRRSVSPGGGDREGVDQADPSWRNGVLAPGGPGELPPGERAFRVGVDEVLEGGLIDEHGGYGPLASGGVVGAQGVVELDAGRADAPAGCRPRRAVPGWSASADRWRWGRRRDEPRQGRRPWRSRRGRRRSGRGWAARRQRGAGARSLPCFQAQVAVSRGSAVSGGRRVAGADVFSAVVRGSRWSCRQPGREGGPEEPPGRGGGADPRAVVDGSGGHRVDHQLARAVVRVGSRVAAVSGLPRRR